MEPNLKQLNDYSSLNDKDIIGFTEKKIDETFAQKKILNFAAQLVVLRRKWMIVWISEPVLTNIIVQQQ